MKAVLSIIFIIFFSNVLSAQITYNGPSKGMVLSGQILNTNDFQGSESSNGGRFKAIIHSKPYRIKVDRISSDKSHNVVYTNSSNTSKRENENFIVYKKFDGLDDPQKYIPPDPYIAAGYEHLVHVDNSRFRITDKLGNTINTVDADLWYSQILAGASVFDPKVIYDHFENRWIMVWLHIDNNNSYYLLSVSDDENPVGYWHNWALPSNVNGSTPSGRWSDYQGVGFDNKAIYITSNQRNFDGSTPDLTPVKIRILDKHQLYKASTIDTLEYIDLWDITYPGSESVNAYGLRPARSYSNSENSYFLSVSPYIPANSFGLFTLNDPITDPKLEGKLIITDTYNVPPDAKQAGVGETIDGGGFDLRNEPIVQNGQLYFTHSVAVENTSAVHYVVYDIVYQTTVIDLIFGVENYFHTYPALALNKNGDAVITYSRSSDSDFMGAYFNFIPANSAVPSAAKELMIGKESYLRTMGTGQNRWGDYNGAWNDPNDEETFWVMTEYVSEKDRWGNVVAAIRTSPFSDPYLTLGDSKIDFGLIHQSDDSISNPVEIINNGEQELVITGFILEDESFELVNDPSPLTLQSLDTTYVFVRFNAVDIGEQEAELIIESNAVNSFENKVTLIGKTFGISKKDHYYFSTGASPNDEGFIYCASSDFQELNQIGNTGFSPLISLTINPQDDIVYGLNASRVLPSTLLKIDAHSGEAYKGYVIRPRTEAVTFSSEGSLFSAAIDKKLYQLNPEDGESTFIMDLDFTAGAITSEHNSAILWAVGGEEIANNNLYIIDPIGKSTQLIGKLNIDSPCKGISFDKAGNLWGVVDEPLENSSIYQIDKLSANAFIFAELDIQGVTGLAYSLDGIVAIKNEIESNISSMELFQNYPNPFNGTTAISYQLKAESRAQLIIYDILGREVVILVDENQKPGKYKINFEALNIPSGVYIYKLKTDQGIISKKMVLLK